MPISLLKNEGRIAPDNTLLVPAFYMVEEIVDWLKGTVKAWMAERLHWTEQDQGGLYAVFMKFTYRGLFFL